MKHSDIDPVGILKQTDLNDQTKEQIKALFEQLNPDKKSIALEEVLDPTNPVTLAYYRENSEIVGIALMCTYNVISGRKGWIEDVVVDTNYRGKGIGRKLMEILIQEGKEKNLTEILLFTEEEKKAAINLYQSLGFDLKNSHLYHKTR